LTLGEQLVFQHVGVAACLPEVFGERVTGPHSFQLWDVIQFAGRRD
jgi:hypothetical protein